MTTNRLRFEPGAGGQRVGPDEREHSCMHEVERLASLRSTGVLDSEPEEGFDRIVALAADVCDAPIALVSLIDADRQWVKAGTGIGRGDTPRAHSFCARAIEGVDAVMQVPDALLDERFSTNPFVTGEPFVRFYAGAVLRDPQGRGLGTLCVIDRRARRLSASQLSALATLGQQVAALIEMRRSSAVLDHTRTALDLAVEGIGAKARRAVLTLDPEGRILGWSGDAERLYGYPVEAVAGRAASEVLRTEWTTVDVAARLAALATGRPWEGDVTLHRRDGSPVRVRVQAEARFDDASRLIGFRAVHEDLTSPDIDRLCQQTHADVVARMARGEGLADLAARLCRVVDSTFHGAHATLMAVDGETGRLGIVAAPSLPSEFVSAFADVPRGDGIGSCGTAAYRGTPVVSEDLSTDPAWDLWRDVPLAAGLEACWSYPVIGPAGSVIGTFGVYRDRPHRPGPDEMQLVTALAALTAIVLTARQDELGGSRNDGLTGLASRDGLERALRALPPGAPVALVALGVDRFGPVNRQFGLEVGDRTLQQVADRLSSVGTGCEMMARFASDQFVLLLTDLDGASPRVDALDPQTADALAERLVVAMREPFEIDGAELWLTASAGVARGPAGQGRSVVHAAVAGARRARRLGGDRMLDADEDRRGLPSSSLELVGALHRAVARGDIEVQYQPQMLVATGAIEGLEALARWDRGDGTSVAPSEFIPLAEEIGLIGAIGRQALRDACIDAARWPNGPGGAPPGLAVNVSGLQLIPTKLVTTVAAALAESGLPARRLTLEVTETALAANLEEAIAALREVRAEGVRIAIDDFGIGYSSLAHLGRFPIDELKIDRSFVERLGQEPAIDAIVRSIISLGHNLGLRCVAEGVEELGQLDRLAEWGCDSVQGHLFSPAVPNAQLRMLLDAAGAGAMVPPTWPR